MKNDYIKNKSIDQSPFEIMRYATWVLAIGLVVTIIAVAYLEFLY